MDQHFTGPPDRHGRLGSGASVLGGTTNMSHLVGLDVDAKTASIRFINYIRAIVSAASVHRFGSDFIAPIKCIRRPGRGPCKGKISICANETEIAWRCTECEANGLVTGWRGSISDLSRFCSTESSTTLVLHLREELYAALREVLIVSGEEEALVAGATWSGDRIVLSGSAQNFEFLAGSIAAHANHCDSNKRRRALDELFDAIDMLVSEAESATER